MKTKTIMLTAGGTGGHLFPAYALGEELIRRGYDVDLVTDPRGDRFRSGFSGRNIFHVRSATLKAKSPAAVASTLRALKKGFSESSRIITDINPAAVIGFGGYPTFPPLLAATFKRIPTAIHEANAVMGRANRMIAPFVNAIATTFEQTKYVKGRLARKSRVTGNPVRDAVKMWGNREYHPPVPGHRIVLVIFGGSQGAGIFSELVPEALKQLPENIRRSLIVIQQCRQEDLDHVQTTYDQAGIASEIAPFFANLPERLASAHLVLARSGASTVAELAIMGRPSILVPLPHALDNDQLLNARQLEAAGGSLCIVQEELTAERLAQELENFFRKPGKLLGASNAARKFGKPNAVSLLADLVEEITISG